jgi:hypothetical protein
MANDPPDSRRPESDKKKPGPPFRPMKRDGRRWRPNVKRPAKVTLLERAFRRALEYELNRRIG